ncbi:hypothetical protein FGE21_10015 [Phaeobacter sp. B1627]|nr:hypothetical protein FGE21_10015 [Phaeobacter sp. B1627]
MTETKSRLGAALRGLVTGLTAVAAVAATVPATEAASSSARPASYVIGNDRGGYLHDRLLELTNLRSQGTRVEIRGKVCYSTCTMYLGLPHTCVDPNTVFGFHGPSRSGRRLEQSQFDYFSRVMADYYPVPLQKWFMEKGRNRISGVHKIRGSEIIRMGVAAC